MKFLDFSEYYKRILPGSSCNSAFDLGLTFLLEIIAIQHNPPILVEETFDLDLDVEYIWNNYFSRLWNSYCANPSKYYDKVKNKQEIVAYSFSTNVLPSDKAKEAHALNPFNINVGILKNNSNYDYPNKEINLSLNYSLVDSLGNIKYKDLKTKFGSNAKQFEEELDPFEIKGIIYHELTHWMDDTFHNNMVEKNHKKYLQKISKKSKKDIKKITSDYNYISTEELNARIHNFKQLKNDYSQNWNDLTFSDILNISKDWRALITKINSLPQEDIKKYTKYIYKRLWREGLLGNRMLPL